jgi:hypothetical protein
MKEDILGNLDSPKELERLYRGDKRGFKAAFEQVYPEIEQHPVAHVWQERLFFETGETGAVSKNELLVVAALAIMAGLIARIPNFLGLESDYFYSRNLAFVVFPALAIYYAWQQRMGLGQVAVIIALLGLSAIYINLLPDNEASNTLILACIHLPFAIWSVWGYTYTSRQYNHLLTRIDFLRHNGDLIVINTVLLIAGGILTAITIGLFELIDIEIGAQYFEHFAIWGLAASPLVSTFLIQSNPQLVKNVSPLVAKIFTPLVLITLLVYLGAIVFTGKDPYNDRDFLIIFNLLLIGVMAIILFSIAETSKSGRTKISVLLLFLLSIVTIVINGIALSAIIFRISEWGITPNRIAVLGANILVLGHLMLVAFRLFKVLRNPEEMEMVERTIAAYLPVYTIWSALVVFVFTVLFGFN